MKYIAKVHKVLHPGIHRLITQQGRLTTADMPLPDYVEIDEGPHNAMLYRYQNDGTFCGDTWHGSLAAAKAQARYEYGILESGWRVE